MYRYLCAGSYKSLIKKGRGTWTGEALATASIKQGIGATSIMRGMIDKSGAKLITKITEAFLTTGDSLYTTNTEGRPSS